jgi:hypothetical protein
MGSPSTIKAGVNYQSPDAPSNLQNSSQNQTISKLTSNALSGGSIISGIALKSGSNDVSHKLGQKLRGWFIVRLRANATIYDTQDSNQTPTSTLKLTSSADVTVDIFVF